MGASLLAIAANQSPSMLNVAAPSRASSLPQGYWLAVDSGQKKGPHPAKETAPEIENLLTRGNHRQLGNLQMFNTDRLRFNE
ncbi:hypothetical protein FPT12_20875 [Pseudomonas sp. H3(2019)]|nr:hypothetical protein FPT12_20875 [Pseudomonas sp. H3(2019)]